MTVLIPMKKLIIPALAVTLLIAGASQVLSEEYRIGSSDVLEIRFWQEATLNATVTVTDNGRITLDIVGEIEVAGKTTTELQDEIVRKISRLNKDISQAVVRVIQYQHNYVYVSGQAIRPGKLTFERIPDLWTIINEAGGATNMADLSRVTLIKGGSKTGEVEIVNITGMIASGQLANLPKVERGDAIEIPTTDIGLPSGDLVENSGAKKVVFIIGAVVNPGPVQFSANMDIADLLILAGGPGPEADLKHARIVSKDGQFAQTMTFDFNKYSKSKAASRYVLRQEDTFIVPKKGKGILGSLSRGSIAGLLAAFGSVGFLLGN